MIVRLKSVIARHGFPTRSGNHRAEFQIKSGYDNDRIAWAQRFQWAVSNYLIRFYGRIKISPGDIHSRLEDYNTYIPIIKLLSRERLREYSSLPARTLRSQKRDMGIFFGFCDECSVCECVRYG